MEKKKLKEFPNGGTVFIYMCLVRGMSVASIVNDAAKLGYELTPGMVYAVKANSLRFKANGKPNVRGIIDTLVKEDRNRQKKYTQQLGTIMQRCSNDVLELFQAAVV